MSLYRRSNGIWYIDHTPRGGGPRIRQSTFTKDKRAAKRCLVNGASANAHNLPYLRFFQHHALLLYPLRNIGRR